MSLFEAIILGIIQGLTEFLPISSTAHVTIFGKLFDVVSTTNPEEWTAFLAIIQMGTLASVLVYFRSDIWNITREFLSQNATSQRRPYREQTLNAKLGWYVIVGSIPIGVIGLALKDFIEGSFTKDLYVIASSLIGLAIVLFIAEKVATFKRGMEDLTMKDALVVGSAQVLALIPGSSRSGTTITAGLFLGIERDVAARFSFLLSIPAVLASGVLEFYSNFEYVGSGDGLAVVSIATLFAFISGYAAIAFLLNYLKKHSTTLFINYRIVAGVALFVLLMGGFIQ